MQKIGYTEAETLAKSTGEVNGILKAYTKLQEQITSKPGTTHRIKRKRKKK